MVEAANRHASKDKVNIYKCYQCKHATITKNLDNGDTALQMPCPQCGNMAMSNSYRVEQKLYATHVFYRPGYKEFKKLPPDLKVYVGMGRLLLREVR